MTWPSVPLDGRAREAGLGFAGAGVEHLALADLDFAGRADVGHVLAEVAELGLHRLARHPVAAVGGDLHAALQHHGGVLAAVEGD